VTRCANIYLVGLMGAGKTTVGRQLAKHLNRRFFDSDHEIESRTGVRVPVIFEIEGEPGFRQRESRVLAELSHEENAVVATGGGIVLAEGNRRCMRDSGIVVYLSALPAVLYERTRHDRNRPLLQVGDPLKRLTELYEERDPIYRDVADIVVEGKDGGGVPYLVQRIEKELKSRCEP
jgi:shikimate kinase